MSLGLRVLDLKFGFRWKVEDLNSSLQFNDYCVLRAMNARALVVRCSNTCCSHVSFIIATGSSMIPIIQVIEKTERVINFMLNVHWSSFCNLR